MENKFIKLESEHLPYPFSVSSNVVENILSRVIKQSKQKAIKEANIKFVTNNFMTNEMHSFTQAFPVSPVDVKFKQQDLKVKNLSIQKADQVQNKRPFSAKVVRNYGNNRTNRNPSIFKNTGSIKRISSRLSSAKTIPSRVKNSVFQSSYSSKLYLLPQDNQPITDQDLYIEELRKRKIVQLEYLKTKQQFFKSIKEEANSYNKVQKRFAQQAWSKNIYYNKNCQTVEIPRSSKNTLKMKKNTEITFKKSNTNRSQNSKAESDVLVKSNNDEQDIFNSHEANKKSYILEEKPLNMFYKSDKCRYEIL